MIICLDIRRGFLGDGGFVYLEGACHVFTGLVWPMVQGTNDKLYSPCLITFVYHVYVQLVWHEKCTVTTSTTIGAPYKPAAVANLKQLYHPSAESSLTSTIGRSQLYVKKNSHAASMANKVSNSSAKKAYPSSDLPAIL